MMGEKGLNEEDWTDKNNWKKIIDSWPRFTNKFSEQKTSRMTNGFSVYKHASWQQRQAESISAGVSVAG
jgi:hypothetical protein